MRERLVGFPLLRQLVGQEIMGLGGHLPTDRIVGHGFAEMGHRFRSFSLPWHRCWRGE